MASGRRKSITDDELLDAISKGPYPYTTASRLSELDSVPLGREAVRQRLEDLYERGLLERDKPSGNAVLYFIADECQSSQ